MRLGGCVRPHASCCDACADGCSPAGACLPNAAGGPDRLTLTVLDSGTDFDVGWSGANHNQPLPAGWELGLCLSECDATTDSTCTAVGPTGRGTLNSAILGTPLPIMAGGVPICIVHRFADDVRGTADVATGALALTANVLADVYVTDGTRPCPPCVNGLCMTSHGRGGSCTVHATVEVVGAFAEDKTFPLSHDCLPERSLVGTVTLTLPLTTGTSGPAGTGGSLPCREDEAHGVPVQDDSCGTSGCGAACMPGSNACATMIPDPANPGGPAVCIDAKGGVSQLCCQSNPMIPCFPTRTGTLVRTGHAVSPTPSWPETTWPKSATGTVLGAVQCYPATTAFGPDQVSGLPGPFALLLNARAVWEKH